MFSFQEYLIGWILYLCCMVGLLAFFWRITRAMPWLHLKQCSRLSVATLLLVPTRVDAALGYWAPAWVKGLLHGVFYGFEAFWPIGRGLLAIMGFVLVVYGLIEGVFYLYCRWRRSPT